MNNTNLFFLLLFAALSQPGNVLAQRGRINETVTTTTASFGNPKNVGGTPCLGKGICNKASNTPDHTLTIKYHLDKTPGTERKFKIQFNCPPQICNFPDSATYTFEAPSILIDSNGADTFYFGGNGQENSSFRYQYDQQGNLVTLECINPYTITKRGPNTNGARRPGKGGALKNK